MVTPAAANARILIEFEYASPLERHTLRLHARATQSGTFGPAHDVLYADTNTDPLAEESILETLTRFAEVWAPYYAGDWHLAIRGLWGFNGTDWTRFVEFPVWAGRDGDLTLVQVPGAATIRRVFHLSSIATRRRRLWLRQLSADHVSPTVQVTPTGGGYDVRDEALLGYLSGTITACVAPDGDMFSPFASLSSWWDRPRAFPWSADAIAPPP